MKGFKIIQPGLLSLLQDRGRYGAHNLGLTSGGPLDLLAFAWANRMLANPLNATCVEISFGGLKLESEVDTSFVITGAAAACSINAEAIPQWQTRQIHKGDILEVGFASTGVRSYLAVSGGFAVEPSFGSTATVVREKIGGIHGDKLKAGDHLPCTAVIIPGNLRLAEIDRPVYGNSARLRVVPGYQLATFDQLQQWRFFNSEYQVTERSDRMGFRLEGVPIHSTMTGMLSEGICHGAIQIPADGQPIVLLNDRQTIGGYPKIGSVIPADTARLAQLSATARVSFEAISIEQANNIHHLEKSRYLRAPLLNC